MIKQRKFFALDFDDLEFFTQYILKNFPDCRKKWQEKLQYVMVDEVQDCNAHDWELFQTLSDHYGNLFVVGDSDQSIYEWRGAQPDLFIHYHPDTDIYLKENFRSVPNIVCLADSIIQNNEKRLPRTSVTMRGASGFRTQHLHCRDEMGALYDTVGRFDPSLWNGTDALIAKLENGSGLKSRPSCGQEEGKMVHHPVFGDGTVVMVNDGDIDGPSDRFLLRHGPRLLQ